MSRVFMNLDSKEVIPFTQNTETLGQLETFDMDYLDVHSIGQQITEDVEVTSSLPKRKQEPKEILPVPELASVFSSEQKRYVLQKMIGRGGYAAVSLATDQDIQRRIAIKTYTRIQFRYIFDNEKILVFAAT